MLLKATAITYCQTVSLMHKEKGKQKLVSSIFKLVFKQCFIHSIYLDFSNVDVSRLRVRRPVIGLRMNKVLERYHKKGSWPNLIAPASL
jgi:hypothetical protein